MTGGDALKILKLQSSATNEEIKLAYNKLVRRYPPEFHPARFREIDEAYRFLISFTHMLERLFSAEAGELAIEGDLLSFDVSPLVSSLEGAVAETKKKFKTAYLWGAFNPKDAAISSHQQQY
jgi:hypothetical protein